MSTQLALEIESQATNAQREINIVKTAVASKQRDIRMLELTSSEIKVLEKDTNIYEGVGKMWVVPKMLEEALMLIIGRQVRLQPRRRGGKATLS